MAESNQYKPERVDHFSEDDPMSELARIMGPLPEPAEGTLSPENEFGIDLEKELLGDFGEPDIATGEPDARDQTVDAEADHAADAEGDARQEPEWQPTLDEAGDAPVEAGADLDDASQTDASDTFGEPHSADQHQPVQYAPPAASDDPLLDEILSFGKSDGAPVEEVAEPDGASSEEDPGSYEATIEHDEELLAADLAALERAFAEQDGSWAEPDDDVEGAADGNGTPDDDAQDEPEPPVFEDMRASLAGSEVRARADETVGDTDEAVGDLGHLARTSEGEIPLLQDEPSRWDGPEAITEVEREIAHDFDISSEPGFDDVPAEREAPSDSADEATDEFQHGPETDEAPADTVEMPEFDEDAFLEQSFIDDALFSELDLDEVEPEAEMRAEAWRPADEQPADFQEPGDFGADETPAAYYDHDAGTPEIEREAANLEDREQASAIENLFEDDGTDDPEPEEYGGLATEGDVPEVETTNLDDSYVPMTEDLDIPDFEAERAENAVEEADPFDGDYGAPSGHDRPDLAAEPEETPSDNEFETYFASRFEQTRFDLDHRPASDEAENEAALAAVLRATRDVANASASPSAGEILMETAEADEEPKRDRRRQGLVVASAVASIAVLGAIGAFALTGGDNVNDAPAIVRADSNPVKVRPENPGGANVPNADRKVYEQVAGAGGEVEPKQETLVTTSEEPIDLASAAPAQDEFSRNARDTGEEIMPKSEDRIDPAATAPAVQADEEIVAVSPRKVKTFVVQPDGTLVQRESPAVAETTATEQGAGDRPPAVADASAPKADVAGAAAVEETGAPAVVPAMPVEKPAPAVVKTKIEAEPKKPVATASAEEPATPKQVVKATAVEAPTKPAVPEQAPIVASRPANQPINIIGRTRGAEASDGERGTQTASADPTAGTTNSSPAWVQVSSHTSRELAEVSYRNDVRRYGSLISGRGVNIVAADVRGRTWYRVNIPAESWSDASTLCQKIKSSGGDCLPRR